MRALTPLDSQSRALLNQINAAGPPAHELTLDEIRALLGEMSSKLASPGVPVAAVEDLLIPGPGGDLPIRIYRPTEQHEGETLPCAVYFHGGGYHFGDLESHDHVSRYICAHADIVVIAVAYRLAPENKFPAAVEDCYATVRWTADNYSQIGVDRERIAVVGDSVGGTLVATTCLLARDRGGPAICFQAPLYGLYDIADGGDYPSRQELDTGEYFVSEDTVETMRRLYFTDPEVEAPNPLASPIRATDFSGLPPAFVMVSEYDIGRDENKAYADRLAAAGVPVEYKCFMGTIHGFMLFDRVLDVGRQAKQLVADRLRAALHDGGTGT
jgi:acetyl esterase